jgi:hypothetical protein
VNIWILYGHGAFPVRHHDITARLHSRIGALSNLGIGVDLSNKRIQPWAAPASKLLVSE